MTIEEVVTLVRQFAEGRAKKLDLDTWADLEVQSIINRKRWWWRKKRFSYTLVVGDSTKDLNDNDNGIATDFQEMIDLRVSSTRNLVSAAQNATATGRLDTTLLLDAGRKWSQALDIWPEVLAEANSFNTGDLND